MRDYTELLNPISKAALTAIPSARTIELAKPRKPRGVNNWIITMNRVHELLDVIYGVSKKSARDMCEVENITFKNTKQLTKLLCHVQQILHER